MNLQPSNRRQDLPVRLGNHGYRLDGDVAVLNAELHVPPYCSGSSFGLELWACSAPHSGGDLQGVKVAEVSLDLPTPIGPHLHRVEARAAVTAPRGTGDHAMVLMLVGGTGEARRIHDFANYGRPQHFASPQLDGAVGYSIEGDEVVLEASSVGNPRAEGNSSGSLSLELWASAEPYAGGNLRGYRLAGAELGSISGQYLLANVAQRVAFTAPPAGRWHVALVLREWTLNEGYTTRDHRNFDAIFEQTAPVVAAPVTPEASIAAPPASTPAAAAAARLSEKVRLLRPAAAPSTEVASVEPVVEATVAPVATPVAVVEPTAARPAVAVEAPVAAAPVAAAPVAAAPVAAAPAAVEAPADPNRRTLSVHTASVDELSRLPGLSLKVAKEIVKNRPFSSIDALLAVRGIGEKTLRRLKGLLTL